MTDVTVHLRYARIAPRKARTVIGVIKGKSAEMAAAQLDVLTKKAAHPVAKLLKAGLSAAKEKKLEGDQLVVKKAIVQEGPRIKRGRPHFRGSFHPIEKQMSHITLVLSDEQIENRKLRMKKVNTVTEEGEERANPQGRALLGERGKGKRRFPSRGQDGQ